MTHQECKSREAPGFSHGESSPLYFWKNARSEFNWFKHVIVPVIGIGVLALPIWGFFAPDQQPPYNSFGWILLGLIAISVAWAVYIIASRPQAAATLGTMIADE